MKMLTDPKVWVVIVGVVGWILIGIPGMVLGLILGFFATLGIGLVVRAISGGSVPKGVRRDLVSTLLVEDSQAVKAAFPNLSGNELFRAIESEVEEVINAAVRISPTHNTIFSEGVIRAALQEKIFEEQDPARQRMLKSLQRRLLAQWYGQDT